MKIINKIAATAATLLALVACEEFQPVAGNQGKPEQEEFYPMEADFTTIKDFVAKYQPLMYSNTEANPEEPYVQIDDDVIITGKIVSTDQPGNFYKSLYIQDETAGIEIKIGKNGLYNDYKPGQTLYIKCKGLYLGEYKHKKGAGSISLGCKTTNPEKYPNSYMELAVLIDQHIIRGEIGTPVEPIEITGSDLPGKNDSQANNANIGRLVTIKGAKYADEIFTLLYLDSNKNKDLGNNRIFLSSPFNSSKKYTWDVTTWALNKEHMSELLEAGTFDEAEIGSGGAKYGFVKERKNPKVAIKGHYVENEDGTHGIVGDIVYVEGVSASYGDGMFKPAKDFVNDKSLSDFIVEGIFQELPENPQDGLELTCFDTEVVKEGDKDKEYAFVTKIKAFPSNYEEKLPAIKSMMGKYPGIERAPASVSQYFTVGGVPFQVRTSGFSKFGGLEIPEGVLNGSQSVDLTGIISMYQGQVQFTLIDKTSIKVN